MAVSMHDRDHRDLGRKHLVVDRIGKSLDQGAANVLEDDLMHFRGLADAAKDIPDAIYEVIAEASALVVVPSLCLGDVPLR